MLLLNVTTSLTGERPTKGGGGVMFAKNVNISFSFLCRYFIMMKKKKKTMRHYEFTSFVNNKY